MNRRVAAAGGIAIFLVAVAVRIVAAAQVRFPVPEDTAYYVEVARNLVHGRGFVIDALWSYQTPPLDLPRAAFEVWLPLPTLIAAVPMALFGDTFRAAQVASVLVGATVPVLAYWLAADVAAELRMPAGRARTLAIGSGLVAALVPSLVVYSTLPDSTMPFAALTLASCLVMTRIAARPPASIRAALRDPRLIGLGVLLGLAALCRSEAIMIGLAWLVVVIVGVGGSRSVRAGLVLLPAAIAAIVFAPWAVRDWIVFGNPLPGQTIANALSVTPYDIYAWHDPPSLARYLAEGPAALLGMRLEGTLHNVVSVLLLPAIPTAFLGLLSLPLAVRLRALRPLLIFAVMTYVLASLVFPVSTTWGTFLHAAGAIQALLVIMALVGLDAFIARVGRFRGWTRPVAWLGPTLAAAVAIPLLAVSVRTISSSAGDAEARYTALPAALAEAGVTTQSAAPVIADHPIWVTVAAAIPALALPNESPDAVLSLARRFGASLVVVQADGGGKWPAILSADSAASACFQEVSLRPESADTSGDPGVRAAGASALAQTRVFRVVCR